jgi:endonuclease/exonuclease/phosphatase family metal-dependent hydrolase
MRTADFRLRRVVLAVLLCALGASLVRPAVPVMAADGGAPAARPGSVVVLSANLREGTLVVNDADRRDLRDLRTFARRMVARVGRTAPDVLVLQEVRGSTDRAARVINARLRAEGKRGRYRVLSRPRMTTSSQACGPVRRPGRHMMLRDSAILVNRATVRRVHATGVMRTWGHWWDEAGCAENPWARLTVKRPGEARRTAMVLGVHVAPHGPRWKARALRRMPGFVERHRGAADLAVLAGDFNHVRCVVHRLRPAGTGCEVRPGHRALARAGYVDTVRATAGSGPTPAGVADRIDFIYTDGRARSAWFDRCYLAFRATRCAGGSFTSEAEHVTCMFRHDLHGSPGEGCSPAAYRRYYSDHHFLLARVS